MDQSGGSAAVEVTDDDNADIIDEHPEILNEVMNRVVETVNEMEDLMQNVIDRRRIPSIRVERRRRTRGQNRVMSDLSRFSSIFSSSTDLTTFSNNEETSQDSSSDDSDSNPTDEERHMDDAATDIDDQVEEEDDDDDDEEEEDDDDDDDDDDEEPEGEDNEGEESNEGYDEDGLELFDPDEGLFRIPGLDRDSDDFLMIEYSDPDASVPLGQPWSRESFFPFSLFEDSGNVNSDGTGNSRIPTHHPLLMSRQSTDQTSSTSGTRTQRMSRTRRYQYVQMNRAAVAAPVFLQRLMSQNSSEPQNYLNIPGHPGAAYTDMLSSTFPNTRLIVMDNGLGILTNTEEEQINFVDQSGYLLGPSLAATLNNVPTSMYWWNEELRLLDRDSICDCSTCVAYNLVPVFEHYKNEEFAERKEKRKKMDDEDDNKKATSSNGETEKKKLFDELSDPMGLIPGSVPYPPPSDPDDGFYRVNPALLGRNRNGSSNSETRNGNDQRAQNSGSDSCEPRLPASSETRAQTTDYRILGSLPVDMSSSSNGSQFLINSPGALVAISQASQRNEALEIEMAANWLQSQMAAQGNSVEEEAFEAQPPAQLAQPEPQPEPHAQSPALNVESSPDYPPPPPPPMLPLEPTADANTILSIASQSSFLSEEIPEGVDPSFLAALPEDMRAEVLSEHLRLQRLQNRVQQNSQGNDESSQFTQGAVGGMEVNADFLAALPPAIQEEVLAQQRLEQQRQAAALSNPNDPVDAAAFFQDLPHSLRQAILTDMEESQISVLPPELAAEAQNLRREWEARNRQLMQERFLSHVTNSTSALSSILRHSTTPRNIRRPTGPRYTIQNMGPGNRTHWLSSWNLGARLLDSTQSSSQTPALTSTNLANASMMGRPRGRQVLDYESICCLLVLLFVDDSRLNTARLHRVFRNLCYHPPTREWVIRAILSIMEKSNEGQTSVGTEATLQNTGTMRRVTRSQSQSSPEPIPIISTIIASSSNSSAARSGSSWLNISMDAALGCRATVFHVHKNPGRRNDKSITINPQAAPFVYRHALEILISLARNFPCYFVPGKPPVGLNNGTNTSNSTALPPKATKSPRSDNTSNFWDLLIRLDSLSTSKKGKTVARPSGTPPADPENFCLESSPFGQLLKMLASPVVHRSPLLMDKLLRLLSLISISLQVHRQRLWDRLGLQVEVNSMTLYHLGLAINVLTSNTCSEEGLEDATALLLNMTVNLANTRETVLSLLLDGARRMASLVCVHIEHLLRELRDLNTQQAQNEDLEDSAVDSKITSLKGILSNRFTKDTVVVTAPKKVKAGLDLQLSSMAPLISKTSSQAFFLRILKVIVQLRESVRNFDKKKRKQAESQSADRTAEVDSSALDEEVAGPPQTTTDVPMDTTPPLPPSTGPGSSAEFKASVSGSDDETPLQPLSEQLNLDTLWNTLSECLTELQHTQDNHAVLVLQPAVEAFFLVHASGMEKTEATTSGGSTERIVTERLSVDRERVNVSASSGSGTISAHNQSSQGSQQSLGLDGLASSTPPPVSPLPSDPSNDTLQPSTSSQYFSNLSIHSNETLPSVPPHQLKFLKFAETHRTVLNQILRQCTTPLLEGPFAVLVNHTRVLDFDVKRRYFRGELERADEGHRREELAVHVRRTQVFEDSFRELHRRSPDEWKNRFYIVFEGEEGQDAGGLLREWYMIISREIFNPMYALFTTSPGDRVTYMINPSSHCNPNHLCYFKFVGRVIAKAIYDNKLLECYFTRSFYKHILGILVKYTDMESEDYSFYQGLVYLMENHVDSLGYELTFSTEVQEFGVTDVRDLLLNGRNLVVTEENKMEYIRLVCQMKMTGAIRKQLNAFLEGFYDIIPKRLISIFNEQELELLISGLPNVDIEDLKANTEYYKYQPNSLQIQWFWRALREFDQAERAKFLQFVTGTSKVPLQGFAALEGMNGVQKFQIHRDERSTDRLPSAHTCFNQLDLPVYETYTKLRLYLLKAIHECSEGFGFA